MIKELVIIFYGKSNAFQYMERKQNQHFVFFLIVYHCQIEAFLILPTELIFGEECYNSLRTLFKEEYFPRPSFHVNLQI